MYLDALSSDLLLLETLILGSDSSILDVLIGKELENLHMESSAFIVTEQYNQNEWEVIFSRFNPHKHRNSCILTINSVSGQVKSGQCCVHLL
jgi:hypothetical protein